MEAVRRRGREWIPLVVRAGVVVAFATVAGCQGETGDAPTIGPTGRDYFGVAWLESGLIVNYEPNQDDFSNDLWRLTDGGELERLDIPELPNCWQTVLLQPTAVAPDTLGFVRECVPDIGGSRYDIAMLTASGAVESLGEVPHGVSQFVWLDSQGRGLAGVGSLICNTLAWFSPDGSEPVDLVIESGGAAFNLAEQYEAFGSGECPGLGRANWPTASPDSTQIAFFASPPAAGTGPDLLDLPWALYVVDLDTMVPSVLLANVTSPGALRWAPDDDRLVFSGEIAGEGGGDGTWLIRVSEPEPRRLLADGLDWMAWSPDGTSVAGILDTRVPGGPREANIVVIDLTTDRP